MWSNEEKDNTRTMLTFQYSFILFFCYVSFICNDLPYLCCLFKMEPQMWDFSCRFKETVCRTAQSEQGTPVWITTYFSLAGQPWSVGGNVYFVLVLGRTRRNTGSPSSTKILGIWPGLFTSQHSHVRRPNLCTKQVFWPRGHRIHWNVAILCTRWIWS